MNEQYWLYNESCMDAMKKMEDDSVDLVLTDPPYNLGLFMKNRATNLKAMRDNFFGYKDSGSRKNKALYSRYDD